MIPDIKLLHEKRRAKTEWSKIGSLLMFEVSVFCLPDPYIEQHKFWLLNQIQKLGISDLVELPGYLSQIRIVEELHNSHLLVLASDIETFGMVLIEAQACGLPVVATDCGGPRDIITPESGILVKPGSVSELTDAIKKLIKSFEKFDPSGIRNSVIQRFGQQKYVESIRNFTPKLISSSVD